MAKMSNLCHLKFGRKVQLVVKVGSSRQILTVKARIPANLESAFNRRGPRCVSVYRASMVPCRRKRRVERKGKRRLDPDLRYGYGPRKRGLTILLTLGGFRGEVSEKLPQG